MLASNSAIIREVEKRDVMRGNFLERIWLQAWSAILVEMSGQEISWLLRSRHHISLLSVRRVNMILSRVRLVAALFALLTPLWFIIDVVTFPREVWLGLGYGRGAATLAFVGILFAVGRMSTLRDARVALGMLLLVPTLFFVYTHIHMSAFQMSGVQAAFATGYAYLPFVMVAGLSVFPLTLAESLLFAAPLLGAQIVASLLQLPILDWPTFVASFWLMLLICAVSLLAGLSQLAFMIVLVREAVRDAMTGCFSRHSGEELLELQFTFACRTQMPLAVVFIDLDHFKSVNDSFGHDAGDQVLISAAESMRSHLRTGDMLVRWGGEEFLVLMPNTTGQNAALAINRVRAAGLGLRPDGTPVTASIGIAERSLDATDSWHRLVEIADARMYLAKQSGRNRVIGIETPIAPAA